MTGPAPTRRTLTLFMFLTASAGGALALNCSEGADSATAPNAAAADGSTTPSDGATSANDASEGDVDAATACPAGFEDFDGLAANGCETKTPAGIAGGALALWLRADKGLSCTNGKVTAWNDQSGHARNAMPIPGHRPPECTCMVGDASVPHFAANGVDAATPVDAGRWDDDTFAVDLSFLANTPYTIVSVDRRHIPSKDFSFFIGTGVPSFDDYGAANTDRGMHLGYRYDGMFWFDQFNNATLTDVKGVDAGDGGVATPLHWTIAINDGSGAAGNLRVVRPDWAGANAGDGGKATTMPAAAEGRLGRGFGNTNLDTRFRGDLPEIIVFTKALSEAELADMMAYVQRHWALY